MASEKALKLVRLLIWRSSGWRYSLLMQFNHLLKLFMVQFFISLTPDKELFILFYLRLEPFLSPNRLLEHAKEVD